MCELARNHVCSVLVSKLHRSSLRRHMLARHVRDELNAFALCVQVSEVHSNSLDLSNGQSLEYGVCVWCDAPLRAACLHVLGLVWADWWLHDRSHVLLALTIMVRSPQVHRQQQLEANAEARCENTRATALCAEASRADQARRRRLHASHWSPECFRSWRLL